MIDLVLYIYTQYSNLSTDEMNSTIEEVKNNSFISCSYARFEYYLILYMDGIINQSNEDVQLFKRILEIGKSSFSNKELSIYYDIKALEKMNLHRDTSRTAKTEASIIELKKFPKAILQPLRPIDGLLRRG